MIPTEAQEGKMLVAYLRIRGFMFTHIANETGSGASARFQGIRNKQQGVSKGFPDYLVIVRNRLCAVELKRTKRSTVSPAQKVWIDALNACGVPARICRGANEAITFIEQLEGGSHA